MKKITKGKTGILPSTKKTNENTRVVSAKPGTHSQPNSEKSKEIQRREIGKTTKRRKKTHPAQVPAIQKR
jgi:hypothetical protein